jgi:hypothetical protein
MSSLRERFGNPQIIAASFLLLFLAQCIWFIDRVPLGQREFGDVYRALNSQNDHAERSPLLAPVLRVVVPRSAMLPNGQLDQFVVNERRWLIRAPFVLAGVLLGASLWYVARRLYGNAGGYIALSIYVFTPSVIARSSLIDPASSGAWGTFGLIFTGIAVSHTLYAPREVVLWNWKRILLLGLSIALAIGSEPALAVSLVLALALMLWLAPHRKRAVVLILLAAIVVASVVLAVALLFGAATNYTASSFEASSLVRPVAWKLLASSLLTNGPAPIVLTLIALVTWLAWKHTRFFGTAAPLLVATILTLLGVIIPAAALTFFFVALPMWMVFAAGVFADLLETRRRGVVLGTTFGILLAHAAYNLLALARL